MKRKKEGSISYFFMPMVFLLCAVLIYVNMYMRSVDTMSDNYKSSLDAANLSVTTVNLPRLLSGNVFSLLGDTSAGSLTDKETASFNEKFKDWEEVLQNNVGLTDEFAFSGGTCGWAGDFLASGTVKVDRYSLYDFVLKEVDTSGNYHYYVICYETKDITKYTTNPQIRKTPLKDSSGNLAEVIRDKNGNVKSSTAVAEGVTITGPTLHTEVSFPAKAPLGLTDSSFGTNAAQDDKAKEFLSGNMRVKKTSTTSLETGN